jgi:hypothetical protein
VIVLSRLTCNGAVRDSASKPGIALADRHPKGLDQTVGELLAAHADPRLRRVTGQQTNGLSFWAPAAVNGFGPPAEGVD